MASLRLSLDISASGVLEKVEEIQSTAQNFVDANDASKYTIKYTGYLRFYKSTATYMFESLEDLKDAMSLENLDDMYTWALNIYVYENPAEGSYARTELLHLSFNIDSELGGSEVQISGVTYANARGLVDQLCILLNCKLAKINKQTEEELANEKLNSQRDKCIHTCVDIFERLPELQARLTNELESEKDVQEFLYPILKSHFSKLQEEDYLPKVAGTASKPDFGIEELGVAIEVKYVNRNKTFKKLSEEINNDSRKYFGQSSPYKTMLVLIYNGASKPTPANFIPDLEHIDVISKVIISPNIVPYVETKNNTNIGFI